MSILIVDDDVEYLHYMSAVLGADGYHPTLVYSGKAAHKEIETKQFSLILMDVVLPDVRELDLIDAAKQVDPLTVCVAMTAFGTVSSAMEAIRRGAYDYLLKPTSMDAIKVAVRRGLQYYELRKALVERTAQMERFKREGTQAAELMQDITMKLKNQLSVIYGFSALLSEQEELMPDAEDRRKAVHLIRQSAENMRKTLGDTTSIAPDWKKEAHGLGDQAPAEG